MFLLLKYVYVEWGCVRVHWGMYVCLNLLQGADEAELKILFAGEAMIKSEESIRGQENVYRSLFFFFPSREKEMKIQTFFFFEVHHYYNSSGRIR